jgi:ubiquitin fusion degradation protein 1
MMHNLLLQEGELINVESITIPVATYARFQPHSEDFLDITNPKAVLENGLRSFACLTTGDIIAIKYNSRVYEMCVLETKPGSAVSIIECDMNVEFAPPVGYKEPVKTVKPDENVVDPVDLMPEPIGFVAFKGQGNRLDGKKRKESGPVDTLLEKPVYIRGIPDYNYNIGSLKFLRSVKPVNIKEVINIFNILMLIFSV